MTYGAGRVGPAFSFAIAGARVRVPHTAALDFDATQDYTVDFWMKVGPQTGSARTLVEKNGSTYPYSVQLLPTGFVTAGFTDGTNPTTVTSTGTPGKVDNNMWRHIAVVFKHSAKVLDLYVDGSLNASQSYSATFGPLANGQDLYFGGRSDGSNSFGGLLDEVDISSTALGLAEVQAIAAAADLGQCQVATFANWAARRSLNGPEADPLADPNQNGLANVLEYALGLNPTAIGGTNPFKSGTVQENGQKYQTFSYTRPIGADGSRCADRHRLRARARDKSHPAGLVRLCRRYRDAFHHAGTGEPRDNYRALHPRNRAG